MSVFSDFVSLEPSIWLVVLPILAFVLLVHLVPYFIDSHGIRPYPGPFLAGLSDVWLGWVAAKGHRSEVVHELHKTHGMCIRLMFHSHERGSGQEVNGNCGCKRVIPYMV